MTKMFTTGEFIEKAKSIHGDTYGYSIANYTGHYNYLDIVCRKHGKFSQSAGAHLSGQGCKVCGRKRTIEAVSKKKRRTLRKFVNESRLVHGSRYDYSKVNYITGTDKVIIICPDHGEFIQRPNSHLDGQGCRYCAHEKSRQDQSLGTEEFIRRSHNIFGTLYDYSTVDYVNAKTKVDILCPEHGVFSLLPHHHMTSNVGCPNCSTYASKGEEAVREYLENNNIKYNRFKKFSECTWKGILEFDFYLPKRSILIEYDGKQHFEPNEWFGGQREFEAQTQRDKVKDDFATEQGYTLLRIPYYEFNNINTILDSII